MKLEDLETIKSLRIKEIDPSKRHVLLVDYRALPKSVLLEVGIMWQKEFGKAPILISCDGDHRFEILEIEPKP